MAIFFSHFVNFQQPDFASKTLHMNKVTFFWILTKEISILVTTLTQNSTIIALITRHSLKCTINEVLAYQENG